MTKNDNHTKISNTKNNGEKSFIQRTCKYRSYPGPGLVSLQITHSFHHEPSSHQTIVAFLECSMLCCIPPVT